MKRTLVIGVLAVLAFAVILIARLPASWVVPARPAKIAANIDCGDAEGTIWNGGCSGLTVQGQAVGDIAWQLHLLPLLSGKVAAHVALSRPAVTSVDAGRAEADVETDFSGKNITARNVKADFPLDPAYQGSLRQKYLGNIHTDLALVRLTNSALAELKGELQAHDLHGAGNDATAYDLGNFSLTFPGGPGDQTGRLRDIGDGPLSFDGTLAITNQPGIVIDGLVAARPSASARLQSDLNSIPVPPDARGRRHITFENIF